METYDKKPFDKNDRSFLPQRSWPLGVNDVRTSNFVQPHPKRETRKKKRTLTSNKTRGAIKPMASVC